jgi:hypothetical protein
MARNHVDFDTETAIRKMFDDGEIGHSPDGRFWSYFDAAGDDTNEVAMAKNLSKVFGVAISTANLARIRKVKGYALRGAPEIKAEEPEPTAPTDVDAALSDLQAQLKRVIAICDRLTDVTEARDKRFVAHADLIQGLQLRVEKLESLTDRLNGQAQVLGSALRRIDALEKAGKGGKHDFGEHFGDLLKNLPKNGPSQ